MQATASSMNYSEKLKDPRWQKIRLKVFERDGFACQICSGGDATLHVHHRYYEKGRAPWDYPMEALITLCEGCHEEETLHWNAECQNLIRELAKKFTHSGVSNLVIGLYHLKMICDPATMSEILGWALGNEWVMREIVETYQKWLSERRANWREYGQ